MKHRGISILTLAMLAGLMLSGARARAAGETTGTKLLALVDQIEAPATPRKVDEKDFAGYLMVYFEDETHGAYFAVSRDGYTFTDVNGGKPVLLGKDVAEQKGVRDPHIARGPNGAFYMALTDLHIFGQRVGARTTQWQRSQADYGWGNNRALVLMKSYDLVHWTHSDFRVDQAFPEFGDIGAAWAPETVYDPAAGKMMVYYTTRLKGGHNFLVYSYANDDFTKLETEPKKLFEYPTDKADAIDGDITKVGDTYHLFYVAHDGPGSIYHAQSDKINSGYAFEPKRIDEESVVCEAPNVWRRNGTDTYVLMTDVYGMRPHNMAFYETTDFKTFKNLGYFNKGVMKGTNFTGPKHGAVISLTEDELKGLENYFGMEKP